MSMTDYLVLGSGIAGLSFALRAAAHGQVVLVTKRTGNDAATGYETRIMYLGGHVFPWSRVKLSARQNGVAESN